MEKIREEYFRNITFLQQTHNQNDNHRNVQMNKKKCKDLSLLRR